MRLIISSRRRQSSGAFHVFLSTTSCYKIRPGMWLAFLLLLAHPVSSSSFICFLLPQKPSERKTETTTVFPHFSIGWITRRRKKNINTCMLYIQHTSPTRERKTTHPRNRLHKSVKERTREMKNFPYLSRWYLERGGNNHFLVLQKLISRLEDYFFQFYRKSISFQLNRCTHYKQNGSWSAPQTGSPAEAQEG